MKQISFKMIVKHLDDPITKSWEEIISEKIINDITPEERAQQIVHIFNFYLKPGEQPRELVGVIPLENEKEVAMFHDWDKLSLMTESGGVDRMKCKNCGATGKRYGLGQFGVQLDKQFTKYKSCPGKKI